MGFDREHLNAVRDFDIYLELQEEKLVTRNRRTAGIEDKNKWLGTGRGKGKSSKKDDKRGNKLLHKTKKLLLMHQAAEI